NSLVDYVTEMVSDEAPKLLGEDAQQTPHLIANLLGKSPVLVRRSAIIARANGITNSIGMKLVLIPKGKFRMGSPKAEKKRSADEKQHEVEITRPFYMGVYEVTQEEFKKVMGYNPSYFSADGKGKPGVTYSYTKPGGGKDKVKGVPGGTGRFPVENVTYEEAVEFCKKLSALAKEKEAGRVYRLPTEAEWEYACRGGSTNYNVFHFGDSLSGKQANFKGAAPYGGAPKANSP